MSDHFQVHVGVADQGVEGQAADEIDDVRVAALGAKDPGNAAGVGVLVFVARDGEDSCEVLDVNSRAIRCAVKALNGERRSCRPAEALRQIADGVDGDQ